MPWGYGSGPAAEEETVRKQKKAKRGASGDEGDGEPRKRAGRPKKLRFDEPVQDAGHPGDDAK